MDPLTTPVYAWDSDEQLPLWSARRSWQGVVGYSQGCNADLGLEDYTVNYAFEACYNQIPSGYDTKSGKLLFDDDKPASWDNKLRNFYTALKFMRRYPLLDQMPEALGYSRFLWYQQGEKCPSAASQHPALLMLLLGCLAVPSNRRALIVQACRLCGFWVKA